VKSTVRHQLVTTDPQQLPKSFKLDRSFQCNHWRELNVTGASPEGIILLYINVLYITYLQKNI